MERKKISHDFDVVKVEREMDDATDGEDKGGVSQEQSIEKYYIQEIRKYKKLSVGEKQELAIRKEAGDEQAEDMLIKCHLRLVVKIANKNLNRGLSLLDLIQAGNVGLMRGIKKFLPKDSGLSIYVCFWIRASMQKALRDQRMIRLPAYAVDRRQLRGRVYKQLLVKLGREPESEEIVEEMARNIVGRSMELTGTRLHELRVCEALETIRGRLRRMDESISLTQPLSLDEPTKNNAAEEDGATFFDMVTDSKPSSEDILANAEIKRKLIEPMLAILSEREQQIIRRRFGLDGEEETLEEIGDSLNLSRQRIKQIEAHAFLKMRWYFQSQKQKRAEALEVIRGA